MIFFSGFLIDFVSGPVSSGFTSAVALIIITSQIKDVLGINASGNTFVATWKSLFQDIHNTRTWDTVFGVICIVVLLLMRVSFWLIYITPELKIYDPGETINKIQIRQHIYYNLNIALF